MANNVPITEGSGASSIAAELVGTTKYQQIKVIDGTVGGTTGLIVNPDGTLNARISGSVLSAGSTFNGSVSGTVGASIIGAPPANLFVGGNLVTTANPVPIQPPASGTLPVTVPGSVITVSQGSIATVIIGGSIAASFTPPANQSVSGTVQTDVRGSVATVIIGGSIAASFTPPANQSVSGTVQTDVRGSVATVIIGGSIATTTGNSSVQVLNFPANQSVSGAVALLSANLTSGSNDNIASGNSGYFSNSYSLVYNGSTWDRLRGNSSVGAFVHVGAGSVITTAQGSVAAVIVGGSIATTTGNSSVQVLNFPTNQSVSGSVGITGNVTVVSSISGGIFPVSGSVAAVVTNFPTTQNVSGSVAAWLNSSNASVITVGQGSIAVNIIAGSIAASFTPPANQSVSGTVQTDVRSSVAVVIIGGSVAVATGNSSVQLLGGSAVIGSVMTLQGTNPWIITGSVQASLTPAANQSVSGTVGASIIGQPNVQISNGASIATIRALPANSALNVAIIDAAGNQITTFGTSNQSVSGTVGASVIGTVPVTQSGTVISSISGQVTVVSSLAGGIFPISGSVAAVITNTNVNVGGSVVAFQGGARTTSVVGSVTAYQGANPWIFTGSVQGNFSVTSAMPILILGGSITGTYGEDTAHVDGDKGLFVLGVRNDTLASVASADREYESFTVGPVGEQIVSEAPFTAWVQGNVNLSTNSGGSVVVIAAQGASVFTYIKEVQVANMGSASVLVTFSGATSSVVGYTIAPAGGGSNYTARYKSNANGAITASISGQASVYVTMTGFTARI
jgi:hypothetical protein